MPLYINFPSWIQPEIFPNIPFLSLFRWYGLMYVFAFGTAFFVFKKQMAEGALDTKDYKANMDDVFSFFTFSILMLLVGARVFSCLIYDTSTLYWRKPWLIFWPFDENWNFTGLQGMSYHGGFVGGLLGMIIWCLWHKKPVLKWIDVMGVSIPLGYTFGRLGNFLNGELFGRITTKPWGMVFPYARRFSVSIPWVQEIVEEIGMPLANGQTLVNLPRHPSQLYEAFFEGIVLFLILWFVRKKKPFDGFILGLYPIGYGVFRFFIEYFREPDAELGYRIASVADAPTYLNVSWGNISTGQILCLLMIAGGIGLLAVLSIKHHMDKKKGLLEEPVKTSKQKKTKKS